jgi:hypothetical protein
MSYTPGTGAGAFTNPASALGAAAGEHPPAGAFPGGVFTPFNPPFGANEVVSIGIGGSLTLRLENYVLIDRTPNTFELGIWENVGLIDMDYPNGFTGTAAVEFGSDYGKVEVSPDNLHWYALNGGNRILFNIPGNYYANAANSDAVPASPVVADFGKPFTGSLSSFDNQNLGQILTMLDGSAGGTWLNLDSVPEDVTQIGFVRFSDPLAGPGAFNPDDHTLDIDAVAINSNYVGAPTPEPGAAALLLGAFALWGGVRKRGAK